jgi:hypothetical protein
MSHGHNKQHHNSKQRFQKYPPSRQNQSQNKAKLNRDGVSSILNTFEEENRARIPYLDALHRFPKCELSYGQLDHTKVQYDIYAAIPVGKKMMAWFTYYDSQCVCFLVNTDRGGSPISIEMTTANFHPDLCLNTVLYGTVIHYDKSPYFCVEDVCFYKNRNMSYRANRGFSNKQKYELLTYMMEHEMSQTKMLPSHLSFMLPYMTSTRESIVDYISNLPYKVYCIQHILLKNRKLMNEVIHQKTPQTLKATFRVRANVQNDIYELYCFHDNSMDYFYNVACIPDYKTSVMMNGIFRDIKENINLDALEESDDEEEFENVEHDKYVDLDKVVHMECHYNHTFQKWVPHKMIGSDPKSSSNSGARIANLKQIGELVRGFYVPNSQSNSSKRHNHNHNNNHSTKRYNTPSNPQN